MARFYLLLVVALSLGFSPTAFGQSPAFKITDDPERIRLAGSALEASIRKTKYVTGVEAGSLLDTKTGFRDIG